MGPVMTIEDFVLRALRVPFLTHGRSRDGWDCWGVVASAYRDVAGIQLPTYVADYDEADLRDPRLAALVETAKSGAEWQRITLGPRHAPRALDVAVFSILGRPLHVGLMVDRRRMLHCHEGVGTVVEPIDSPMWAKRLEGIYRHA
jgi:cell wall-associated NlpC family hydrolase